MWLGCVENNSGLKCAMENQPNIKVDYSPFSKIKQNKHVWGKKLAGIEWRVLKTEQKKYPLWLSLLPHKWDTVLKKRLWVWLKEIQIPFLPITISLTLDPPDKGFLTSGTHIVDREARNQIPRTRDRKRPPRGRQPTLLRWSVAAAACSTVEAGSSGWMRERDVLA